jgi:ABC-type polysaccharide/polyol phosphate transport system ATPase subunit
VNGHALSLADVGKRYVKYEDAPLLLTRAFRMRAAHKRSHFWAVRHVDLAVERGESVGILGRNGSGKTTTLRMLAGVTAPTEGAVSVAGRVAPLISVGVGFHQELTGRENVYVNGAVLGMRRKEIDRRFDAIVDFAEIADFIDTPVKFYSSGMFVRLGFSVAVSSAPDVLLVDEVLAVGDLAFQSKCFDRMQEIKSSGTSIVVVSHNLNAIRQICGRVIVLHDGESRFVGDVEDGISVYHELLARPRGEGAAPGDEGAPVEVTGFELFGADGKPTRHVNHGDEAVFRIEARYRRGVDTGFFGILLLSEDGRAVYADSNYLTDTRRFAAGERTRCEIRVPAALAGGSYRARGVVAWGGDKQTRTSTPPLSFYVAGRPMVQGVADLEATFRVDGTGAPESGSDA